jgi:NADH dehydrogenase/NADH:ubiquinone oxidoreductase subunit G
VNGRFVRVAECGRKTFTIMVDGVGCEAAEGDTVLVAVLNCVRAVRDSEFGDGRRAGFCLMGACQDCWVWCEDGTRLRACTTPAAPGMSIVTRIGASKEGVWPHA